MKNLWLFASIIFLQNCSSPSGKTPAENAAQPEYYAMADFDTVEKYDTHVHINANDSTFIKQAKKDNLRLLTVNVNSGRPIEEQRSFALLLTKNSPTGWLLPPPLI
jgi:hypothetical protein